MISSRLRRRIAVALLAVFCAGGVLAPAWHGVEHAAESARATHQHADANTPVLGLACPDDTGHGPDCFLCQRIAWARLRGANAAHGLEQTPDAPRHVAPRAAHAAAMAAAPRAPPSAV